MEEIIGEEARPLLRLRTLLEDFQSMLKNEHKVQSDENFANAMKLHKNPKRLKELEENCSHNHLLQEDDNRLATYIPGVTELYRRIITEIPKDAFKLQTFKTLMDIKKKEGVKHQNPFIRTRHSYRLRQLPKSQTRPDCFTEPYTDLLIYIRIYRQARATHAGQCLEKPVFAEEFQCLGSNLLTELRDKISCVCNGKRFFEISENPTAEPIPKTTDPAFFFITDTFYNDKRNSDNADYSEVIRKWAKKADGLQKLNLKVAKMEETRFIDLTVSLGFPQLYQHHGNCEHAFVFSQIEVIGEGSATSMPALEHYPLLTSFSSFNNRMCNMCGQRSYVFIVEQSDRQLHDPAYLCNKCFFGFHYVDGKKIGEFKAYKVNDYEDEETPVECDEEAEGEKFTFSTDKSTSGAEFSKSQPSESVDFEEEFNMSIEVDEVKTEKEYI